MRRAYPEHVFLELHMECNLRCVQCDIYTLSNPPGELTLEERLDLVGQVAEWHPDIRIVSAGGEPFGRRSMLYEVAAEARRRGVYMTASTNGTLIRAHDVERLPSSGIRCIVVSLDSDEADVHARIRGVPGTFERATRAIRDLVAARDRSREDFTVLTSTILGAHNLHRVGAMLDCFEELGIDTTLFQPIQPAFARNVVPAWWLGEPLYPRDRQQVDAGMDELVAARRVGRRVFQTETQLEDMRRYLHQPRALDLGHCASMEKHLMVDMTGNVRLCFNMERIGLGPVANARTKPLQEIWTDALADRARETMRACREGCGSMLCHAR